MLKTAEKFVKEIEECKDEFIKVCLNDGIMDDIEPERAGTLIRMYNLLKVAEKLTVEQAEMLDSMDAKLDKLLAKRES